ncbi:MAG TPA: class I SAM-dependent methyltransferase [Thermoanaerobaculia bacterium]|nr:class I SAM-dependent methyltransferase [Thermoanaerobaculia bacterium]
MDEKPSGAGSADAAALARDLVGRLTALSASLSPGLDRPEAASAATSAAGAGAGPDFGSARMVLENGARFVSPCLPGDAPLRPLKALLLRILRIVTRDQTVFNSAVLDALRGSLLAAEGAFRDHAAALSRLRAEAADVAGRVGEADSRLTEAVARNHEALGAVLHETQLRLDGLEKLIEEKYGDLRLLRLEWTTLRAGLQAPARAAAATPAVPAAPPADDPLRAGLYVDFEEAFRGSEEEIRRRQEADVALFGGAPGPVADLGCGRGEFLEGLRAAGVRGVGCDANPVMAARAREKGLEVDRADLFEWLAARPDGSLGGVTAYQVVEHLPAPRLFDLVELAAAKLAPGGVVLFETVNPESAYAMKWFWMDLTHVRPVPAPSLARLLSASGFRDVRIDWRSPVPASEAPPAALRDDANLGPVVRLLFGPQDYAAIGRK